MNGMLTAANIDFRPTGGKLANSHISASPVNRLSEEIYSQQAVYMSYTLRPPDTRCDWLVGVVYIKCVFYFS